MKLARVRGLVAVLLLGTACTPGGAGTLDADGRAAALEDSAHAPRQFMFSSTRSSQAVDIEGSVEDDYRYTADVSIGGSPVYEEVVIDDRRWLRVFGGGLTPTASGALAADAALAPLLAGEWVMDASGAPPEFEESGRRPRLLGPGPVVDVIRRLDTLQADGESVARLRGAKEYDPESVDYLEREDKFDRYPDDGVRFDVKPLPYDPDAVFGEGVPPNLVDALEPYALYTSFWIDDGRVTRIETFFDIDRQTVADDMKVVLDATGLGEAGGAAAPEVPRPYRESLAIEYSAEPPRMAAPETAIRVRLPEPPG